jgi:hypothetical protein
MRWLKSLFGHDYERGGPGFYDPKQRAFSLFKCMLIWVGVNVCIEVMTRVIVDSSTNSNVYAKPWLLLMWMAVGAFIWWVDKIHYSSWLSKRSESSLRVIMSAGIEKGVRP